ncbi:MAG: ATP-binding cassette domain-containing protein [Gammaproteobacteria bacterium]|nr:ATP-binding cassette domain-containing protein [Gammaproteobacteria bacterium]
MSNLSAHNLTLSIDGRTLCESLSLSLVQGEVWAVLGPNGSGKSTLLRTLAHLQEPEQGEVHLDGKHVTTIKREEIARKVGVLFQEIQDPFPITLFEQVLGGRYPHLSRWSKESELDYSLTNEAIEAMGLKELSEHLTHHLSGGERQRTAFATLLAQQPEIYLLDEPLNHLDLPYQMRLLKKIVELSQQGKTILMVLHDPNVALRWSSHTLLLHGDGRWLSGPSEEIITSENLSELYHHPLTELTSPKGRYFIPK